MDQRDGAGDAASGKRPFFLEAPPPYQLRPLRLSDLDTVIEIERASLPTPAKKSTYEYELKQNRLAHYYALVRRDNGRAGQLLGYAGAWLMAGELHIIIIAVDPAWRGRGLGELLLLNFLFLAHARQSRSVTLEVRRSNHAAQALYKKYGFVQVGERQRYYRDTGEDALIMTIDVEANREYPARLAQMKEDLFARLNGAHL